MSWAIFVCSSDRYIDLALKFEQNFTKFWPAHGMRVYYLTNEIKVNFKNFVNITSGQVNSWSESLMIGLEKVQEENLIVFLDDTFLIEQVNNEKFEIAKSFFNEHMIGCLHPRPIPRPHRRDSLTKDFSIYGFGTPYSVNVYALWKRQAFLKCLIEGENPQEFEISGNYRFQKLHRAACTNFDLFSIAHLIVNGKWVPQIQILNEMYSFDLDISKRSKITKINLIKFLYKQAHFNFVVKYIPYKLRINVLKILQKILVAN